MSNEEVLALRVDPAALGDDLEEFARRVLLVSVMKQGATARAALERLGISRTPAWATKLLRRYREFGENGLLDLRKYNGAAKDVMTFEVQSVVLRIWHHTPAAGAILVGRLVEEECTRLGLPVPSRSAVKAYLDSLPEAVKITRGGRFVEYDKQARTTLPIQFSRYANQRFQADHTRLDIWARHLVDGQWVPVQLWLTVLLDDYSRAIAGIAITKEAANSWSITRALRHAFLPKKDRRWPVHGMCEVFQCDRGADFMSHAITAALGVLGVTIDPDPPYYPNRKGSDSYCTSLVA
jgi:putative transposase